MNPLEISDILNLIVEYLIYPQNLLVNRNTLNRLYNNHNIVFIRSHRKSDIPKYGSPKFLSIYTDTNALDIAVKYGNLLVVKSLIVNNVNSKHIQLASENGHIEIVKYLVSLGADYTANNNRAIQWASLNGHLAIVKYLVLLGADYTANNNRAIQCASRNGHLAIVKYLVLLGADYTANNNYAIQWASGNGHLTVVKYLVSLGADYTAGGGFAIRLASKYGHTEIVEYLKSLDTK